MNKIILCSSRYIDWIGEYYGDELSEYTVEFEFGNAYILDLIEDVKSICDSNENYFIHTYSKEVLELFAKYIEDSEFKFARLYIRNGKIMSVDYSKEEFIDNIYDGWDIRWEVVNSTSFFFYFSYWQRNDNVILCGIS